MSETPCCATCAHWQPFVPDPFFGPEYNARHTGAGCCRRGESENGVQTDPLSLAWALDGEECAASLRTRPGFFCVQFQPVAS